MAREKSKRKQKFRAAVIGEGITEWHYFYDLKQTERLPYQLTPSLPKHSNYQAIFKKAQQLAEEGYDHVYVIIDIDVIQRDTNVQSKYETAKHRLLRKKEIFVFETMPCTEYWFLLHFQNYSTRIYPNCKDIFERLYLFLPNYEKSNAYFRQNKIYRKLKKVGNIEQAVVNAQRLCAKRSEQENPLFPFSELGDLLKILFFNK